jgi:opacity protein-like surface antigen
VLTFAGAGASAHLLNGDGAAINGTFVEDLLDSVTAGFNLHAGLEYPVTDRFRVYGQGRYEVLGDLQYVQVRTGLQFMIGGPAPGEERAR